MEDNLRREKEAREAEQEREERLRVWRDTVLGQIEELRARQREEKMLEEERLRDVEEMKSVEDIKEKRRTMEERRKKMELG